MQLLFVEFGWHGINREETETVSLPKPKLGHHSSYNFQKGEECGGIFFYIQSRIKTPTKILAYLICVINNICWINKSCSNSC